MVLVGMLVVDEDKLNDDRIMIDVDTLNLSYNVNRHFP